MHQLPSAMIRFRYHTRTILCALLVLSVARNAVAQGAMTTVIVVRHADRAEAPMPDPPLTMPGRARAEALADALASSGVEAIITTQYSRTKATAAPLARRLGLVPEEVVDSGATHARDVARAIHARHAGQTVLVVDHGHSVPAIVAELGAPRPRAICEDSFDLLFIVMVPATGRSRLVTARYGDPSPPEPECKASAGAKRSDPSR